MKTKLDAKNTLRSQVALAEQRGQLRAAEFFSDKLVSAMRTGGSRSGGKAEEALEEALALARVFHQSGQYRRALHILNPWLSKDARAVYWTAKSHIGMEAWEEALDVLGGDLGEEAVIQTGGQENTGVSALNRDQLSAMEPWEGTTCVDEYRASLYLLKGHVHHALQNKKGAVKWYQAALTNDPFAFEAWEALVDHHLLLPEEEETLMGSLSGPSWLKELYQSRSTRYQDKPPSEDVLVKAGLPADNADMLTAAARAAYYQNDFQTALETSKRVLESDPFRFSVLPVHISCLVESKSKAELFYLGHKLVQEYPKAAVAWYAVGAYYSMVGNHTEAWRFYQKSTMMDKAFAPAWIAAGHSFSLRGESDAALSTYRAAQRSFPGSHFPPLYIGMEALGLDQLSVAQSALDQAGTICSVDPLVYNELGVVAYKSGDHETAVDAFRGALARAGADGEVSVWSRKGKKPSAAWEVTYTNLGHALRRLGRYPEALKAFECAIALKSNNGPAVSGIAFTYHLMGKFDDAIDQYHRALALDRDDVFSSKMLKVALEEVV